MREPHLAHDREDTPPSSQSEGRRFQTEGRGIVDSFGTGFYVNRRADEELLARLSAGEYCHVLAPRQIGKSSLRVRTRDRLEARGMRCAAIDLTGIGTEASPAEWYFSLAAAISEDLSLSSEGLEHFWRQSRRMSPVRRFRQFLSDMVLGEGGPPVAIFVDEIDVTLKLPFSRDDFFGLIREIHQSRAAEARWARLSFCLIGVATPLDLVNDAERTPFNTSVGVRIDDFSLEESKTLLPGLSPAGGDPPRLLRAILHWTGGHPALTQRLCYWLTERVPREGRLEPEEKRVARLVHSLFLKSGRIDDPILHDIEKRFADDRPDARVPVMLHLYRRLLDGEEISADGNNPRQFGLRIAGLSAERQDERGTWLCVRNRIVEQVFSRAWVDDKLARRLLTEPLEIWKEGGRKDDHVLRGEALEMALKWAEGKEDVTPDERDYLNASQAVARREQEARKQAEVDRAMRDKAMMERRSLMIFASIAAALVVLLFVLYRKEVQAREDQASLAKYERDQKELAQTQWKEAITHAEQRFAAASIEADAARRKLSAAQRDATDSQAALDATARALEEANKKADLSSWFKERARHLLGEYEQKDKEAKAAEKRAEEAEQAARLADERRAEAQSAAEARTQEVAAQGPASLEDSLRAARIEAERAQKELNRRLAESDAKVEATVRERDAATAQVEALEKQLKAAQEDVTRLRNQVASMKQQRE